MSKSKSKTKERKTVVFLLDETGSMEPIQKETVEAFNTYLAGLAGEPIDFHLTLFNSAKVERRYQGVPVDQVAPLTAETYRPANMTPLYDAIGQTAAAPLAPKKALMVILTDGHENASKEYTFATVKALIDRKTAEGWDFLFLARGLDVVEVGVALTGALQTTPVQDSSHAMRTASLATADYLAGQGQQSASSYAARASGGTTGKTP